MGGGSGTGPSEPPSSSSGPPTSSQLPPPLRPPRPAQYGGVYSAPPPGMGVGQPPPPPPQGPTEPSGPPGPPGPPPPGPPHMAGNPYGDGPPPSSASLPPFAGSRQQQQQQQQQPPHPQQQQIPLPPHHQAQPSLQSSQPIIPPRAAPRGTVDSYGRPISMQYSGRSLSPPARHLQQPSAGPAGGPTMGPIASPPPPSQPFMHSAPQPQSQRISHVPPQHPHGPDAGMNQGSPSSPDMEQQGANRALNVDDALAYLNHVKIQFQEQPDVYNSFLDIMKEFKSQSIDTPGVIERVSSLFHGHPELINGFNTFLPPGFRIEASSNPNEPIRVITPGSHLQEAMPVGTMVPVHPPSQGPQHGHPPIGTYNSTAPPPRIGGGVRSPPQPDPFYPNVAQPIAAQFGGPPPPAMGIPNEGPHGYPISHPSQAPAAPLPPIADLASGAPVKYESSVPAGPPPMPQPAPHHAHMAMHPTGVPTYQTVVSVPPTAPQAPHSTGEPAVAHMQNAPPPAAGGPIPAAGPVPAQPATGPSAQSATAGLRRQPVEFNHAINYVNKIKNRFSNEPDIYKQFFEILQTYQKEGKPIQEVYDQVQGLFKGSPDLLDEFKQFLPDTSQANQDRPPAGPSRMPPVGNFPSVAPNDPRPPTAKKGPKRTPQSQPPLSISSSFGAPPLPPAAVPPGPSAPVNKKRAKPTAVPPPPTPVPITHPIGFSGPVPLISGTMIPPNGNQVVPGQGPIYQPPTAANIIPAGQPNRPDTIEELEWIDRCKRTIGNKATYNEFLKVLNLFSQEIIDAKTLVERVEPFLSKAPELFDWFKKFVKYEENQVIHNVPADRMETDVRTLRRVGHSYRKLPSNYPKPPCSGRDDLCNEVLNDDWISQPEYVSETGFVSHRKTQYEEALHKCEEERYEFDLNIEANLQTIALLEPIYRQIQSMSPEQRTQFKLPPGIGGTSKTIYQRVIKKVYDNDRGLEMIEHLHESPAVAVPIILKRLKQKDEEWKRSQRDWNKVWREVDAKNYYKAMDHQGVSFKTTDKKSISPKALLNEIDNLHREQKEHRKILLAARSSSRPSTLNSRSNPPGINRYTMSPLESSIHKRYQLEFRFPDSHIFRDARRLIMTVVSQTNSITQSDEDRIGDFLSLYVRRFFSLDSYEYGKDDYEDEDGDTADGDAVTGDTTGETNAKDGGVDDSKSESTDDAMEVSSPSAYDATPATGGATGDSSAYSNKPSIKPELRKELLVRRATSSTGIGNGKGAEAESESGDDSASISSVNGSPQRQRTTHTRISKGPRRTYPFYANGTFYTFMRLYQILYSRLLKMKELSNYYEMYPPKTDQINPFAVEMGLQRPENIQDSIASDVKNRFEELHRAIHDFLDSKIEQSEYEEKCRSLYGTNAFLMFTIDKVLQAIVKQLTNIISENVNFQLADLYYKERDRKVFTQKSENLYRLTAQNILAQDDVLYRFEYFANTKVLTIGQLNSDDTIMDTPASAEEHWSLYVDNYISLAETDGVKIKDPFLKRNLPPQEDRTARAAAAGTVWGEGSGSGGYVSGGGVDAQSGIELKLELGSYKLYFVENTEDYYCRVAARRKVAKSQHQAVPLIDTNAASDEAKDAAVKEAGGGGDTSSSSGGESDSEDGGRGSRNRRNGRSNRARATRSVVYGERAYRQRSERFGKWLQRRLTDLRITETPVASTSSTAPTTAFMPVVTSPSLPTAASPTSLKRKSDEVDVDMDRPRSPPPPSLAAAIPYSAQPSLTSSVQASALGTTAAAPGSPPPAPHPTSDVAEAVNPIVPPGGGSMAVDQEATPGASRPSAPSASISRISSAGGSAAEGTNDDDRMVE